MMALPPEVPGESDSPRDNGEGAAPVITVIVPVYREERNIRPFLARLVPVLDRLGAYEILFCVDPSTDSTEAVLLEEIERNPRLRMLVFSRRFGQPAATMAGILNGRGQWCVVIDVDLQDPPELIPALWRKAHEGFDVVTARRATRRGETWLKRIVSSVGYTLIDRIAEVPIPRDTGDFRLMSRRVVEELRGFGESNAFLRGLVSLVGFAQAEVQYPREARHAGSGNYNRYIGSLRIAFNGVFGFSNVPLQLMLWSGLTLALLSLVGIVVVVALKVTFYADMSLAPPVVVFVVVFVGGIQLAGLGVLGEYLGRIYDDVRGRPMYIIDRAVNIQIRNPRGPRAGDASVDDTAEAAAAPFAARY